jgi:2-oxoglutarate ferredoxin oxidoreductase subunit alpha
MTEMPVVIMVGMRPGPATGLATRTAQADLLFAISAGHGEFARAVLAPADAQQAFTAGQRAFAIAERHRTPVIVLFDQFVADASWTVQEPGDGAAGTAEPAGPRPGTAGRLVYLDSDEHTAEGHITESARVRVEQSDRRLGKMKSIAQELLPPECSHADAATLVFCFGSTRGVVAEAVSRLRARARSVGMVHLCDVWPFPTETVRGLAGGKRLLTVENNYTGQLARLIRQETLLEVAASVRRFDGRQFRVAEVEAGIEERLG